MSCSLDRGVVCKEVCMDTVGMYIIAVVLFLVSLVKDRKKTVLALRKGLKAVEGILPQLLVVVLLISGVLSILDSKTISRFIGESSGFWGMLMASVAGSITLIPGFVAFPAAGELLRNGAGTLQIAAFVSSLMMVGVVTLPMEIAVFGKRAALTRNVLAFVFSILAAFFVNWVVSW